MPDKTRWITATVTEQHTFDIEVPADADEHTFDDLVEEHWAGMTYDQQVRHWQWNEYEWEDADER